MWVEYGEGVGGEGESEKEGEGEGEGEGADLPGPERPPRGPQAEIPQIAITLKTGRRGRGRDDTQLTVRTRDVLPPTAENTCPYPPLCCCLVGSLYNIIYCDAL